MKAWKFLPSWLRPAAKAIDTVTAPVIGNYNLTAQLPNGRSIAVAGYLYEGEGLASINDRLDLCQEAIERQRIRCEIPELAAKREQMIVAMGQMKEVLAELETKRTNGQQLSSQERVNLNNMQVNIKRVNADIGKGEVAISEAKRKAGVG